MCVLFIAVTPPYANCFDSVVFQSDVHSVSMFVCDSVTTLIVAS